MAVPTPARCGDMSSVVPLDARGRSRAREPPVLHQCDPAPRPSTDWRLATLPQQRQLRFRGADARHDAIEFDQSYNFISGSGFLHAHLGMVLPSALSRAKPS